jgi:hypothetical protein
MATKSLALSDSEISALLDLFNEEAMRMDDDGREGAFDASPLRPIERRLRALARSQS